MPAGGRDAGGSSYMHALRRKTLVLDLDETLVHSQFKRTAHCDIRLDVSEERFSTVFYVSKRPYLDVFLRTAAMWYNLVIYTASLQKYADPLISMLDPDGLVTRRLFRSSCRKQAGAFVKDLSIIEPDLRDVIIIDNSPAAYCLYDANAIPVEPWYDDQKDDELLNLLPLLHAVAFLQDVRSLLSLRLTNGVLAARLAQRRRAPAPREPPQARFQMR
jgi:CTD nuclear envelope phosphatase 1